MEKLSGKHRTETLNKIPTEICILPTNHDCALHLCARRDAVHLLQQKFFSSVAKASAHAHRSQAEINPRSGVLFKPHHITHRW